MIGKRIKELRQARGMTQTALAKGICSRTFISAIEIGRVKPSVENLQAIADRLAEPLSSFLPDGVEEAMLRMETNLNRAKAMLAAGQIVEAKELWHLTNTLSLSRTTARGAVGMPLP